MLAAVCFDSLQTGLFFFFPPRPLFPIFSGPPPSAPAFSPVLDKERDSAIRGIRWRLRLAQPIQASPEQPTCHGRHSTGARVMTSLKARRRLAGGRLRRAGEQCADGLRRIARIFVGARRAGSDKSRYAWFQGAVRCCLRPECFGLHVFQEPIGAIAAEEVRTKVSGHPFSDLLVFRVPFALPVKRASQTRGWLPLLKHD